MTRGNWDKYSSPHSRMDTIVTHYSGGHMNTPQPVGQAEDEGNHPPMDGGGSLRRRWEAERTVRPSPEEAGLPPSATIKISKY